jgi:hypothetical protein
MLCVWAVLICMFYGFMAVEDVKADPIVWIGIPSICITSPIPSGNYSGNVTLTFYGEGYPSIAAYSDVKYLLDGIIMGTLDSYEASKYISITLTGLADGRHTVEVTAIVTAKQYNNNHVIVEWTGPFLIRSHVSFAVDSTGPNLHFMMPQNSTFEESDIALNFTAEETLSKFNYSLDNQANCTLTDSLFLTKMYEIYIYQITLYHLEEGSHCLKVCAYDALGNLGELETYYFTVVSQSSPSLSPNPSPSPSPTQEPNVNPTPTATPTTQPTDPTTPQQTTSPSESLSPTQSPLPQFLSTTGLILTIALSVFLIAAVAAIAILRNKTKPRAFFSICFVSQQLGSNRFEVHYSCPS